MTFLKRMLFALLITVLLFSEETSGSPTDVEILQKVPERRKVLVRRTKLHVQPSNNDRNETTYTKGDGQGCFIGNQRYFEGQFMPDVGGSCKACYCLRGMQYCTEIRCNQPDAEKDCLPIMVEGRCCPVGYDCENRGRRENSKFASEGKLSEPEIFKENPNLAAENDYKLSPSDMNSWLLENHIRIERQSEIDHVEDNEVISTTESAFSEDTTVHTMTIDIPTKTSENMNAESMNAPEKGTEIHIKESDVEGSNNPSSDSRVDDQETDILENSQSGPFEEELSQDPGVTETTFVPILSISKLLSKFKETDERNKEPLSDILPDSVTGTRYEEENYDEAPTAGVVEDGPDFVSYDINVGTSLIAGDNEPIGVGQVFPVDINHSPVFPPSRTPVNEEPEEEPSFLDSFLNLFTGGAKPTISKVKEADFEKPPTLLPPPPFNPQPLPPLLPPPPPPPPPSQPVAFKPSPSEENLTEKEEEKNRYELKDKESVHLDLEAKPTIENEVRTRPRPPPGGSITRNELPIRRRPTSGGALALRPGLFASRPNFPISKPTLSSNIRTADDSLPELPSEPVIEGGFEAIKSASNDTEDKDENVDNDGEPTLPPSLPNLQIIPFVAADAVVSQRSPPDDNKTGFTPKPFGGSALQDCREGGKVWKNGELVAQRDDDPCVLCRCLLGKVICQRLECPNVPDGCTAEDSPAEGECCPEITCDKAANVSIIDTLPIFRPIKIEKPETVVSLPETPSRPIRPSPFAHLNRRPPFSPLNRPQKPSTPLPTSRKPATPPRLRSGLGKRPVRPNEPEADTEESAQKEEISDRSSVRRPIRPIIAKIPPRDSFSPPRSPLRPSLGSGDDRLRPYSSLIRTGTRRPFIPPRRTKPTADITQHELISSTTIAITTTSATVPETTSAPVTSKEEMVLPLEIHFQTEPSVFEVEELTDAPWQPESAFFENLFSDVISKEKPFLPSPIHSKQPSEDSETNLEFEKPFSLPPDLLLPKPLPPSDTKIEADDLINFVQQDKFHIPQIEPMSETIFDRQSPKIPLPSPKPALKPLPEIPESVKAQLPLGNDPILVSGLLELGGCNVYGRMFDIGERIKDISGRCKACQCTKVGVQCLPIC